MKKNRIRLNKAIAATGFCSRRKADALIFAGRVQVNGCFELNPASSVLINDVIHIDSCRIQAPKEFIYVLLNKPIHSVSTVHDPQGRRTVINFLPEHLKNCGLYPVGRLDYFSEGLLLLTNDGELTHRLTHPSAGQLRDYEVTIRGKIDEAILEIMRSGMILSEGEKLLPIIVRIKKSNNEGTLLHLTLGQGINRQIRRMCRDLNLTILRLKRISHGILNLGALPSGRFRLLVEREIDELRRSVGLS